MPVLENAHDTEMLVLFKEGINVVRCTVPQQTNGFDCGVYVVKCVESFLKVMHLKDKCLKEPLHKADFNQEDVTKERVVIRQLIDR